MSLCDQCPDPGRCCRKIPLSLRIKAGASPAYAKMKLSAGVPDPLSSLPFEPLRPMDEPLDLWGERRWLWSCPHLNNRGGCGIYEIRPHHPCRSYQPAEDRLCIFWHMQVEMDVAFGAPNIFADDAFDGPGEWSPPASDTCKDAAD